MKKEVNARLWGSFIKMIKDPNTLKNYEYYYTSIVLWIENNKKYFTEDVLKKNRLNVLINLDPVAYIVDNPGFSLQLEFNRFEENKPNKIDTFAMIIGDRLWNMVTIRAGKDCPNCKDDELLYLLSESALTKKQKIILECNSCAWTENIDGSRWDGGRVKVIPANKWDLEKFGIR